MTTPPDERDRLRELAAITFDPPDLSPFVPDDFRPIWRNPADDYLAAAANAVPALLAEIDTLTADRARLRGFFRRHVWDTDDSDLWTAEEKAYIRQIAKEEGWQ